MSKQLYEEALADVKRVKEVAEDNAKRAIIEAVTPRIRDMIERELLSEAEEDDEELSAPGSVPIDGQLMTDDQELQQEVPADAITPPDDEGKVTLDLDALASDSAGVPVDPPQFGKLPNQEYEINMESTNLLKPVLASAKASVLSRDISKRMTARLNESQYSETQLKSDIDAMKKLVAFHKSLSESINHHKQIAQMISRVEDMYGYVQESIRDSRKKNSYELQLESLYHQLNKLQEPQNMSKVKKFTSMNESDLSLKLTGLPDDIDLEAVGVDLVSGDDEDVDDLDVGDDVEGGDEDMDAGEDELDLDDLDVGDGSEEDEEVEMGESARLSDDTIVEIDEGMLRREIARMKRLREDAKVWSAGEGVSAKEMDDFGGASEEGEPLTDIKVTTEADGSDDDEDVVKETDELPMESLKRRLAYEKRLQERAKAQASKIKSEAARTRNPRKVALLKKEYAVVSKRFTESKERTAKISRRLAESAAPAQRRLNGGASNRSEEVAMKLRKKLAETNLTNAKLMYTNKLLQNESISAKQKADIIEQLDSAETLGEVKRVFHNLSKLLVNKTRVNEGSERRVLGSSSRITRPSSTPTVNEGFEAERWAKLAGIDK